MRAATIHFIYVSVSQGGYHSALNIPSIKMLTKFNRIWKKKTFINFKTMYFYIYQIHPMQELKCLA